MRLAVVVCILHTTTAKQEDLLLLREDQCADALFVAHWTHVPQACRATFAFNRYDHEVYEHAHRLFCSRLQSAGLRGDEAVETELASSNLCGALDFSKVDDVCGRLETRDVLLKKAAHDARCAHRGPGAQPRVADESIGGLFSRLRGA